MNLSFWKLKNCFSQVDYAIVGSGIVGFYCALRLRELNIKSKILTLKKEILTQGANTKNAGFTCFASISEITTYFKQMYSCKEKSNLLTMRPKVAHLLAMLSVQ